ncbi:hypothetical protein [Methanosarcina barkeri]|uniref:Uncharacterized protein n=1 Tax=Methanosarcina barkeri CM1 TaxID=796385 RepID=A0A0G3CCP0_METBA|nr:hypothetical protein [Methanosarcina barkeri]AKJ38525.1 hypothetical protein MCM1_1481 [Methanosarcina barkeri CM1]
MTIPSDFEKLVNRVEETWDKPGMITDDDSLWYNFCIAALLGGNLTDAEVNYEFNILNKYRLLDREKLDYGWIMTAKTHLLAEKEAVEEPNKRGKIAAINKLDAGITDIEIILKSADSVFNSIKLNAEYIQSISEDLDQQKNLLVEVASSNEAYKIIGLKSAWHKNKIYGIAYTKALIWLHNCGICLDLIPNNNHSIKFLEECKVHTTNDFFVVNTHFSSICELIKADIYFAGIALWYYEATRSLVPSNFRNQYSPKKLIKIMDKNNLDLNDISDMIADIERVEELKSLLKSRLSN